MPEQITVNELVSIVDQIRNKKDEDEFDITKLRYAIYARKSTDDPKRQAKSLSDQILECQKVAISKKLRPIPKSAIFKESQSAKVPDIRPVFRNLIDAIKEGKYDGILSWHPDRLARNMKEAGEIIDLLDARVIKDLQFVSFYFENNSTGKMVLGITLVMAKQYSDQLSTNVKRGQKNRIESGQVKGNLVVHGYFRDVNSYLRPDGENFSLIRRAWELRMEGETQEFIAEFLNKNNYQKAIKIGGRKHQPYKFDKTAVSNMLRDPVYAGVLVYGQNKAINLCEVADFVPLVTADEFSKLNKEDKFNKVLHQRSRSFSRGEVKSDLMRGKVFCGECKKPMHTGLTTKKNSKGEKINYFYYRCETDGCKYKNKSVRAKLLTDFVYKFLDENKFDSRDAYEQYRIDAEKTSEANFKLLDSQQRSLRRQIVELSDKIIQIREILISEKDKIIKNDLKQEFKREKRNLKKLEDELKQIKSAILANKESIIEYPKFLELFGSLPQIIRKNRDIKWQDFFIKKIFSNFTISEKIVSDFELNEPFKTMLKPPKVGGGRGERT